MSALINWVLCIFLSSWEWINLFEDNSYTLISVYLWAHTYCDFKAQNLHFNQILIDLFKSVVVYRGRMAKLAIVEILVKLTFDNYISYYHVTVIIINYSLNLSVSTWHGTFPSQTTIRYWMQCCLNKFKAFPFYYKRDIKGISLA